MNIITHFIKTFSHRRHAELVSASLPRRWGKVRNIQFVSGIEAWVLKQVQDDGGVWA
jgi:hypothetical protein